MDDPVVQGLHREFSQPQKLASWVKAAIVELIQSIESDLLSKRFLGYLSRWRQPEELYCRTLYVLFLAKDDELPHIFSGARPNGFAPIYRAVNQQIFDGRGMLETQQAGLDGGKFTAMQMLNDSAHGTFRLLLTCMGVVRNPEYQKNFGKHLDHLKRYCVYLNYMEQALAAGKSKADVFVGVKNVHKPASAWMKPASP